MYSLTNIAKESGSSRKAGDFTRLTSTKMLVERLGATITSNRGGAEDKGGTYTDSKEVADEFVRWVNLPRKEIPTKVYIFETLASGYGRVYKIGCSKDPKSRLNTTNIYSPYKCNMVGEWLVDNAKDTESELHRKFNKRRTSGEWFLLSGPEYRWMVKYLDSIVIPE